MWPWAWDPQLWVKQMMYFGWLLMVIVGIAVALLLLLGGVLGMWERTMDEASELNAAQQERWRLAHGYSNRAHRKSADV